MTNTFHALTKSAEDARKIMDSSFAGMTDFDLIGRFSINFYGG
jgi:hypothetical protein